MKRPLFALLALVGMVFVLSGCGPDPSAPPPPPPTEYTITQYGGSGNVINQWHTTYWYTADGLVFFKQRSTPERMTYVGGTVVVEPTTPAPATTDDATDRIVLYNDDGTVMRSWDLVTRDRITYWVDSGGIKFVLPSAARNVLFVLGNVVGGPIPK